MTIYIFFFFLSFLKNEIRIFYQFFNLKKEKYNLNTIKMLKITKTILYICTNIVDSF